MLEAELIERRLDVVGDLLIEARMADENGWHLLLPDRSTSIQVTSNSSHYTDLVVLASICTSISDCRLWHMAAPDVCDGTSAVGESRHRIPRRIRWSTDGTLLPGLTSRRGPPSETRPRAAARRHRRRHRYSIAAVEGDQKGRIKRADAHKREVHFAPRLC